MPDPVSKKRANRGTLPLHTIEALMVGLVGAREGDFIHLILRQLPTIGSLDGRIILSLTGDSTQYPEELEIKYQLLNPSTTFREVVDSARSVILAGGTMSPVIVIRGPLCLVS